MIGDEHKPDPPQDWKWWKDEAYKAQAEIARLREPFEAAKKLAVANAIRCEKAEAEIARLRGEFTRINSLPPNYKGDQALMVVRSIARAALKPDTGETK